MKVWIAVMLVCLLVGPPLEAQNVDKSDWKRVAGLKQGTRIILLTTTGLQVKGIVGDAYNDGIMVIVNDAQVLKYHRDEVREIHKQKVSIGRYAAIAIGGGAGTGWVIGRLSENEATRQESPGLLAVGGMLVGITVGGVATILHSIGSPLIYRSR